MMDVQDLQHRQIQELSGGQRKRALIARALARQPQNPAARRALRRARRSLGRPALRRALRSDGPWHLGDHDHARSVDRDRALCRGDLRQRLPRAVIVAQGDPTEVLTENVSCAAPSGANWQSSPAATYAHRRRQSLTSTTPCGLADELQLHMDEHEHRAGHRPRFIVAERRLGSALAAVANSAARRPSLTSIVN